MSLVDEITDRLLRPDFEKWADQAQRVGHCARPVRLVGGSDTIDARTGELVSRYSSTSEPDGVTYVRCGNRRAARCPSCSDEYKGDMWHLLVAGAAGGEKGVPESVATHPLVFVTLTAPSFGAVHTIKRPGSRSPYCHPRARSARCEHGRPLRCMVKHSDVDSMVGEPLCAECYDYESHLVWQWYAPELWRRFIIRVRRELALSLGLSEKATRELVRVQFAKVAEFQRRGVVHFHALLRLDGAPLDGMAFPPPAVRISGGELAQLALRAAARVSVTADPLPWEELARDLSWGAQVDARVVGRDRGGDAGELTDRAVAAYIAKYATKATEDVMPSSVTQLRPHVAQLFALIGQVADHARDDDESAYQRLGRWASMLGFRGHFSTKSRRYSTTLGRLRAARRTWRARSFAASVAVGAEELDDDSTLVIGHWEFQGMGWLTSGDAALAAEAAAAAREWRTERSRTKSKETREEK